LVGDPYQSNYRFAGAAPSWLTLSTTALPDGAIYRLPEIFVQASRVIADTDRLFARAPIMSASVKHGAPRSAAHNPDRPGVNQAGWE